MGQLSPEEIEMSNEGFAIARVYPGDLNALVKNLMKATGITDPNEVTRSINAGEWQLVKIAQAIKTALLELVGTVVVKATTGKFVAKEKFVINTTRSAPVKISYLGDNFTAWFLNGDGKIEDTITEQTLYYHKLRQSSVDGPVIDELGGEAKAETTLSEMFSLMGKQKHGEDGVLLNNGWANLFYIKDGAGVLRSVGVLWLDGGWYVLATSVELSHTWHGGGQVFSRNSVLENLEPSAPAQA